VYYLPVASPIFKTKEGPKSPLTLAKADLMKIEKARSPGDHVMLSAANCQGLFLLAINALEEGYDIPKTIIPKAWLSTHPRIYLIFTSTDFNPEFIKTIQPELLGCTSLLITRTFEREGFEVIQGGPTRFERADVI
jgi:hypothetical protein